MTTKAIIITILTLALSLVLGIFAFNYYGKSKQSVSSDIAENATADNSTSVVEQPLEVTQKVIWSYAGTGLTTGFFDHEGCQNMDENLEGYLQNGWKIISFQVMNERKSNSSTQCFGRDVLIEKE